MEEPKVLTSIRFKESVKKEIKLIAVQKDVSMGDVIEELLENYKNAKGENENVWINFITREGKRFIL